MKKLLLITITAALTVSIMTACTTKQEIVNQPDKVITAEPSTDSPTTDEPMGKIAINIEGIVTDIQGDTIILDNGQSVVITEETEFQTQDVWETVDINDEIQIGNKIQGFTTDDTSLEKVTALVINQNSPHDIIGENSLAIFKGVITELQGDSAVVTPNSDQNHILSSGDKVSVNTADYGDFAVGDEIVVYYSGEIMESYPLQINVSDIELLADFNEDLSEENTENSSQIETGELLPVGGEIGGELGIIDTEIIINVTKDYDGSLNDDLKNVGAVSVRNIFNSGDTIMYLVTLSGPNEQAAEQLEALDYINYVEYNQMVSITN